MLQYVWANKAYVVFIPSTRWKKPLKINKLTDNKYNRDITKLYMFKLESVPENQTYKIPIDLEIQTDYIKQAGRLELVIKWKIK